MTSIRNPSDTQLPMDAIFALMANEKEHTTNKNSKSMSWKLHVKFEIKKTCLMHAETPRNSKPGNIIVVLRHARHRTWPKHVRTEVRQHRRH